MRLGGRRFLLSFAIIGAAVFLALGISLPILKLTKFMFWTSEYSLLTTVEVLIRQGQTFLGVVVLLFSIVFPIVKLLYLLLVSTLPAAELAPALQAPQGHRVDRQMVDARRAGAGADDLLPQEPGRLRRGQPAGGLLLHRRRGADDPVLRLAEDGSCRGRRHGPRAGGAQAPVGGAQLPALASSSSWRRCSSPSASSCR